MTGLIEMDDDYTIQDAVAVIEKAVERKRREISDLERRVRRYRREDRIEETQTLIDYLRADLVAYLTVLADMKNDESVLEGVDTDDSSGVECPANWDQYIAGLSADDLENELEADEIRADHCDGLVEMMCYGIGEAALRSKKMVKFMLEDPYALSAIGEMIFYDDYLYDSFRALMASEKKGKKKKKKRNRR